MSVVYLSVSQAQETHVIDSKNFNNIFGKSEDLIDKKWYMFRMKIGSIIDFNKPLTSDEELGE